MNTFPNVIRSQNDLSLTDLPKESRHIYIVGGLSQGLYRRILDGAPHLENITLSPSNFRAIHPRVQSDARARNITLNEGSLPKLAWFKMRQHKQTKDYQIRKKNLESLPETKKRILDSLVEKKCPGAKELVAFYGLKDVRVTQRKIMETSNYASQSLLAQSIAVVFLYLNPQTPASKTVRSQALKVYEKYLFAEEQAEFLAQLETARLSLAPLFGKISEG